MYIAITGSKNNKDVYIYRSFRKENGKASSCIYKKLGKYNAPLLKFWQRKRTSEEILDLMFYLRRFIFFFQPFCLSRIKVIFFQNPGKRFRDTFAIRFLSITINLLFLTNFHITHMQIPHPKSQSMTFTTFMPS